MSKHFKSATTADLVRYGRAWDRVYATLFRQEPFEPTDDVPDDETYCALYCAKERREFEDCALVGGCPLARKGDLR